MSEPKLSLRHYCPISLGFVTFKGFPNFVTSSTYGMFFYELIEAIKYEFCLFQVMKKKIVAEFNLSETDVFKKRSSYRIGVWGLLVLLINIIFVFFR